MKDLIFENWRKFLKEARDFPSLIHSLAGNRENIHTIGMITAENPQGVETDEEQNAERNEQLMQSLKEMNLGYRKIRGKFGDEDNPKPEEVREENSFLVPNISKDEIINLGKKYDQQSVIWGERKDDKFVFEYIECDTGEVTNTRDVTLHGRQKIGGKEVQQKKINYSRSRKGPEKFVVPFFADEYEMVSEYNIPNPDYNGPLNEEINKRTKMVLEPNRTGKSKWYNRGVIKELNKKTWK